ncbi:cysteine methyltransferase [Sphingobacteriaceae bacterium]|nr:cysteine methyltransferase [Sphingobacteriaceae bacterium]
MNQKNYNYERIAQAIDFIRSNFKSQPSLELIAEKVNMSPFHFQRLFTEWAGVSPKKFLQYISLQHAKSLLQEKEMSLFDTAHDTGLSGSGRLHDLFLTIEGMSPGEYKNGGENLNINYSFAESHFGKIIVGSTAKGICHIAFTESKEEGLSVLKQRFPNAFYSETVDRNQQNALLLFTEDWNKPSKVKLHLKGTDFQLKVWELLLKIPTGKLSTYGAIAKQLDKPLASRAVGTAIGDNPVAFLIPCHRVIQTSGGLGGYMWGETRKTAMIGWEAAFVETDKG